MLEDFDFEVECPNCGSAIKVNGKQVGKSVKCKKCRETIKLEDSGFKKEIAKAEKEFKKMFDGLGK